MDKKSMYRQIMDAVSVSPKMERRILARIQQQKPVRHFWKVVLPLVACAAIVIGLSVVPPLHTSPPTSPTIGSPMQSFDDISSLAAALPFDLLLPSALPDHYQLEAIHAISGEVAALTYRDGEQTLRYRMGQGDISGDYTIYPDSKDVPNTQGYVVTLKGEDGQYASASWSDGTYSFSITVTTPLSETELLSWTENLTRPK